MMTATPKDAQDFMRRLYSCMPIDQVDRIVRAIHSYKLLGSRSVITEVATCLYDHPIGSSIMQNFALFMDTKSDKELVEGIANRIKTIQSIAPLEKDAIYGLLMLASR